MAIIGMYDYDMTHYAPTVFNLDLMKLSTYYKKKRDIVSIMKDLDLNRFSKVYYRKDYYDGLYDTEVILNPVVEYGGNAFSNNQHLYLPLEIETLKPDKELYVPMRNLFSNNDILFQRQYNAQHFRLSLDGKEAWNDFEKQLTPFDGKTQTFILHDYNLAEIADAPYIIKDLMSSAKNRKEKYLGTKFPIKPKDEKDLLQWAQFKPMAQFCNIDYHHYWDDSTLHKFVILQNGTSLARQASFWITGDSTSQQDFVSRLPYIYQQIVYLRSQRIRFSLKYDATIIEDERWKSVIELIIRFYGAHLNNHNTFMGSMTYFVLNFHSYYPEVANFMPDLKYFTAVEGKALLDFVKEKSPELYESFERGVRAKLKEGRFVYE